MKPLKVLVTAGATEVPIDRVRAITNVFKGKTGTAIAFAMGYREPLGNITVTLLTSNPHIAGEHHMLHFGVVPFRTFDELAALLEHEIRTGGYDVVIHSAAVSDYRVAGVHARRPNGELTPLEASGKVGSSHERLFLELERTPKLIEAIRHTWDFTGKLIQFKLEVGITDEELIARARAALVRSRGDLVVANCLEWARDAALLVGRDGDVERVERAKLPDALIRWCVS